MTEAKELAASVELDAMVAEKVMGWVRTPNQYGDYWHDGNHLYVGGGSHNPLPPYSTDIAAAAQVARHLCAHWKLTGERRIDCQQRRVFAVEFDGKEWQAGLKENDYDNGWEWDISSTAPTPELAICRAALAAVTRSAS